MIGQLGEATYQFGMDTPQAWSPTSLESAQMREREREREARLHRCRPHEYSCKTPGMRTNHKSGIHFSAPKHSRLWCSGLWKMHLGPVWWFDGPIQLMDFLTCVRKWTFGVGDSATRPKINTVKAHDLHPKWDRCKPGLRGTCSITRRPSTGVPIRSKLTNMWKEAP